MNLYINLLRNDFLSHFFYIENNFIQIYKVTPEFKDREIKGVAYNIKKGIRYELNSPEDSYTKNKKYTLVIKNMKSLDQNGREDKILPDINMDFTIKK